MTVQTAHVWAVCCFLEYESPPTMSELAIRPWKITALIAGLGVIGGAAAAVILTYLGNIISGAPRPAPLSVYIWNIRIFAILGGVFSPVFAWGMLRNAPIWRIVAEPAAAGVLATVGCMLFAPSLFPAIGPAAILTAMVRLSIRKWPETKPQFPTTR